MLCVLFIGARMRALQMDPLNGAPQKWAQNCFFMCTYGVITQALISIAVPLCFGGKVKEGKVEGDMGYEEMTSYPILAGILSAARWIIMICIYVGAACADCGPMCCVNEYFCGMCIWGSAMEKAE